MTDSRADQAGRLMEAFADDTGLTSDQPPRRYLWTDAHAVCNWLALADRSGEQHHLELARALVSQVHDVLGRFRGDDPRHGWISGLSEAEGRRHPTSGGLRIGKPLPERPPGTAADPDAEWQQDGQYYHYLTKWMHALQQMARHTAEAEYARWARELAVAAHQGFRARSGPPRLYWKMSTDLGYPLVASSGQHDPLDGLITCLELDRAADDESLTETIADLELLCRGRAWTTDDALGIGGLLFDCGRLAQLGQFRPGGAVNIAGLLTDTLLSLRLFSRYRPLDQPAGNRLAFRELGLAIGLQAFDILHDGPEAAALETQLNALRGYLPLRTQIVDFWLAPENQRPASWTEHRDINRVMLATSLVPEGFLSIRTVSI